MKQIINVFYKNKNLPFWIRPEYKDKKKIIDIQVLGEIFDQNVYKLTPEHFKTGTIIDLGSNIGAVAIQAAQLGAIKIIAIEPNKSNLALLEDNLRENNCEAEILRVAIGAEPGETSITDEAGNSKTGEEGEKVNVTTLEEIISFHFADQEIDVLKIDVEGDEYKILLSTPKEALEKIRVITMEFHATDEETFGKLICKLSESFVVETIGSFDKGGQITGRRY